MVFSLVILSALLVHSSTASSLVTPPESVVIVAFEDVYDLSLLAYTVSDLGFETVFIVPSDENDYYEGLNKLDDMILKVNITNIKATDSKDERAVKLCESFISNRNISKYISNMQPTFVVFPAVRHDSCLLPWATSINSSPIIWARGYLEELYVFVKTGMALPVHESGFIGSVVEYFNLKYFMYTVDRNYVTPTQKLVQGKIPKAVNALDNLYSSVQLVLWGADPILRVNSAFLTQLVTEIGCHHCRGPLPLPAELQKGLVTFKTGTVIILLDKDHDALVRGVATKLESMNPPLAVLWKNKHARQHEKPANLFIEKDVDRQDLIGYSRGRLVICHCTDSEFLESAFHGTPMICFPRNMDEMRNAQRAVELGFGHLEKNYVMSDVIVEKIKEIHENSKYRENARIASQGIRDRTNHAMDRIRYWFDYTARHKGEGNNLLLPKKVMTYNEVVQTLIGFLCGAVVTMLGTLLFFVLEHVNQKKTKELKKKPHRK